jgi:hypothetical protein
MFTTIKSVQEYTGKDLLSIYNSIDKRAFIAYERSIDPDTIDSEQESRFLIKRAQSIIEIFIGKDEIDIQNPSDLLLLDKMTAYQTAYMLDNENTVFNQVAVTSQGQTDFVVNFDTKMASPWIAPLAFIASRGLSFKKGRSIKTGKIFQWPTYVDWRSL